MAAINDKVESLLELLDDVERAVRSDPSSLEQGAAKRLVSRLKAVAELVDRKCNVVILDYESSDESTAESEQTVAYDASAPDQVKLESTPTPPMASALPQQSVKHETQMPAGVGGPTPPSQHSAAATPSLLQQQSAPTPASMYKRFSSSQPQVLDEPAKKRRREAEIMVRNIQRPKTFNCGISYQGDQHEKDFSDGIKEDLKHHLPALRNHMHMFHYMAWATTERLECQHCRKCPNEYQ